MLIEYSSVEGGNFAFATTQKKKIIHGRDELLGFVGFAI